MHDDTSISKLVQNTVEKHSRKYVGLAISAFSGDNSPSFGFSGVADRDSNIAVTKDTIFEIGSLTKVFTGLLLAKAVVGDRIHLTDSLESYLGENITAPSKNGTKITLGSLASHTSGLPRNPATSFWKLLNDIYRARDGRDPYGEMTYGELTAVLSHVKLKQKPGHPRLNYSNMGYGLLGHVLSHAYGDNYENLVINQICNRLNMDNTRINLSEEQKKRFATGHSKTGKAVPHWGAPAIEACGDLKSSISDLAIFLQAQCSPPSELASAIKLTQQPQVRMNDYASIGLDWMIMTCRGLESSMYWHDGGTGGFRSFVVYSPETRVGVIGLANSTGNLAEPVFDLYKQIAELSERL